MYFYQYDPRIHNFGNIGKFGAIHAEFAPLFTKLIDLKAYNGRNIREEIINKLNPNKNKILDLCCGIGISTAEYGIDTSKEMINKAERHFSNKKFIVANAENININELKNKFNLKNSDKSNNFINFDKFDYVTSMFSFHEMPKSAHEKIIENSLRLAKKEVLIIDISPIYKPSKIMLSGEPYLIEYQKTIEDTMNSYKFNQKDYIKEHVTIWNYKL